MDPRRLTGSHHLRPALGLFLASRGLTYKSERNPAVHVCSECDQKGSGGMPYWKCNSCVSLFLHQLQGKQEPRVDEVPELWQGRAGEDQTVGDVNAQGRQGMTSRPRFHPIAYFEQYSPSQSSCRPVA